jgi:hypothetical protein
LKKAIASAAILWLALPLAAGRPAAERDDLAIWREFVGLLKSGAMTADRIDPDDPRSPESRLAQLADFAAQLGGPAGGADWREWEAAPVTVRDGDLLSFIITLGRSRNSPWEYVFCFRAENGRWRYRFIEGIFLRLDKIAAPPVSSPDFPDAPEERKSWMRQEIYWSEQVRLFNFLAREKGKDFAFRWVADGIGNGVGYLLGAATWVPFVPKHRAFILYLCWEFAKLQGDAVTLEKLDDQEAVVRLEDLTYFALYMRTTHLKQQIALEDYIKIFETIWQARARAAGWTLVVDGRGRQIYLRFSR